MHQKRRDLTKHTYSGQVAAGGLILAGTGFIVRLIGKYDLERQHGTAVTSAGAITLGLAMIIIGGVTFIIGLGCRQIEKSKNG